MLHLLVNHFTVKDCASSHRSQGEDFVENWVLKEPVGGWGLFSGGIFFGCFKWSSKKALPLPPLHPPFSSAGQKLSGYSA